MSPDDLAAYRHDLANPVNHVLGYAELLMMGATERQATELEQPLQELARQATELRRHLEEQLPTERIRTSEIDLPAVRSGVSASAKALLEHVSSLRPQLRGQWVEAEADLEQIATAARRLLHLAEVGIQT